MDSRRVRTLSPRQRALIAVAVLLDGREAAVYLENDAVHGSGLKKAAIDLAMENPALRMPFVGTMLRTALEELEEVEGA